MFLPRNCEVRGKGGAKKDVSSMENEKLMGRETMVTLG